MPQFNEYLNVNTPLQIGGMAAEQFDPLKYNWGHTPMGKPFDGCIRNIVHNSKLYDLAEPGKDTMIQLIGIDDWRPSSLSNLSTTGITCSWESHLTAAS